MLPDLSPEQHVGEVQTELIEAIDTLRKPSKKKALKALAKAIQHIAALPPI